MKPEPEVDLYDDYDDTDEDFCDYCGDLIRTQGCPACWGEGLIEGEEIDPLYYPAGKMIPCADCNGKGYHTIPRDCLNDENE